MAERSPNLLTNSCRDVIPKALMRVSPLPRKHQFLGTNVVLYLSELRSMQGFDSHGKEEASRIGVLGLVNGPWNHGVAGASVLNKGISDRRELGDEAWSCD